MKKLILFSLLNLLPFLIFAQNIKVKSSDITDLKIEISNLKIENQKLVNEVYQLKENFTLLEKLIKSNSIESNQKNFEKLNTAILFLGQDINNLFKGYIKNMPDKYSSTNSNLNKSSNVKEEPTNQYSGQCNATTKKGTRCSRTAKSNGYCWQHGG